MRYYIGIKGCGIDPPDSGMYVNSLQGIEFNNIEQIANADQVTYQGVWDDVTERADARFTLDVLGKYSGFNDRYRLRQITQSVDLGKTTGGTNAPSANQSGVVIELNNPDDQYVCSNMQTFYVQSVQFYCVNSGSFTLTIKDADLGTALDTFTVTGVQGWNVKSTDKSYDGVRRISITVDTTSLSTTTFDISSLNLTGLANNIDWWYGNGLWFNYGCSGAAQVRGYQTDINYQNPVYGSNTFGISCVFSVRCTYNNIVCNNKRYFANAYRLLLGIELMTERIYSSRINRWTTTDAKTADRLRKEFEVQYRGGQLGAEGIFYEGELNKACSSIDLDLTDCCLECSGDIQWRETQL